VVHYCGEIRVLLQPLSRSPNSSRCGGTDGPERSQLRRMQVQPGGGGEYLIIMQMAELQLVSKSMDGSTGPHGDAMLSAHRQQQSIDGETPGGCMYTVYVCAALVYCVRCTSVLCTLRKPGQVARQRAASIVERVPLAC
jgi:hypothetical protein